MNDCLIVDDSGVIRTVVRRIMESIGFTCREAEDGQVAMSRCQEKMPDIIMLDWNMPVMTGIEFLKLLRATAAGKDIKVFFCTTENDMNHIQMAMQHGATDFIMKPFDKEIVQSKLEQNNLLPN